MLASLWLVFGFIIYLWHTFTLFLIRGSSVPMMLADFQPSLVPHLNLFLTSFLIFYSSPFLKAKVTMKDFFIFYFLPSYTDVRPIYIVVTIIE